MALKTLDVIFLLGKEWEANLLVTGLLHIREAPDKVFKRLFVGNDSCWEVNCLVPWAFWRDSALEIIKCTWDLCSGISTGNSHKQWFSLSVMLHGFQSIISVHRTTLWDENSFFILQKWKLRPRVAVWLMEESVSWGGWLRSCYSGLMVFPPSQDLLGLGIGLGAEKSRSLFLPELGTWHGLVSLWQSPGFGIQLLSRAGH